MKREAADLFNQNQKADINSEHQMASLPRDILAQIFSYLTAEEIINFKRICASFNSFIDSSLSVDALLQPLLNRLKAIDSTVSSISPPGLEQTPWRLPLFKKLFVKIANEQWDTINNYKKRISLEKIQLDQAVVNTLNSFNGPSAQLKELESRAKFLTQELSLSITLLVLRDCQPLQPLVWDNDYPVLSDLLTPGFNNKISSSISGPIPTDAESKKKDESKKDKGPKM
ncbi:MAG: F-box protein [Proteobacteria bacterium]|nr:F-box protein [Pseudomonadota bacterium]